MKNAAAINKTAATTEAHVGTELNKVGVTVMTMSAAVVGLWGTACLFAGTISSGGPLGLISNLLTAITG
jgi:hypothetical protein